MVVVAVVGIVVVEQVVVKVAVALVSLAAIWFPARLPRFSCAAHCPRSRVACRTFGRCKPRHEQDRHAVVRFGGNSTGRPAVGGRWRDELRARNDPGAQVGNTTKPLAVGSSTLTRPISKKD